MKAITAAAILLGLTFATFTDCTMVTQSVSRTIQLEAFEAIQICSPLSVLVMSDPRRYSLSVVGEPSLHQSVQAKVAEGVLHIEANASFELHKDAKLTVSLPHDVLKSVSMKATTNVYISGGFKAPVLDLDAMVLGGAITAEGIDADLLKIRANGVARITATGSFSKADVQAGGTARIQVSGVERQAAVLATGEPSVAFVTTSTDAILKGTTQGSVITYTQGKCSIKIGMRVEGGAACKRNPSLKIAAAPMQWVCQAKSNGIYTCGGTGSSSKSFASVGSDCQYMRVPEEPGATEEVSRQSRRLRQTSISTTTSTSNTGAEEAGMSSFTYTSNTPSGGGKSSQTVCNFVNNVGSCTVNGSPVPVRQYGLGGTPVPAPDSAVEDILNAAITAASTSNTETTASGSTSNGGTVCTFVNGIGGCSG